MQISLENLFMLKNHTKEQSQITRDWGRVLQALRRKHLPTTTTMLLILLAGVLTVGGCGKTEDEPKVQANTACLNATNPEPLVDNVSDGSLNIINNDDELDQLITCDDAIISVKATEGTTAAKPGATPTFDLVLVAEVVAPSVVGKAAFVGNGINDMTAGGIYTGTTVEPPYVQYKVEIDSSGAVDTFRWSEDQGATWAASNVAITGLEQALSNGVTVTFAADTGHTVGDGWYVDAGITQATSVSITGNTALVSYSMAGPPYLGAVQVFNLIGKTAHLKSQAIFRDMDVNAVTASGSSVFVTGSHEPVTAGAIVQQMNLSGGKLSLVGSAQELASFSGTGMAYDAGTGKLLVTDGNTGGLSLLNATTLVAEDSVNLDDARGVDIEGTIAAVVLGCCGSAADGAVSLFDLSVGTLAPVNTFAFTGADVPEAKSTVELVGQKLFLAAGTGGAQIMNSDDGAVLGTVANPTDTGLDAGVVVTNAVSVDRDLMFISNGEAGVYVAQNTLGNFNASGAAGPVDVTLLGGLQFGALESVNHVEFKSDYLFVAAGLGGVKIVRLDIR